MDPRPMTGKDLSIKGQLEASLRERTVRSSLIRTLEDKNNEASREIDVRGRTIEHLLQANDIENRIISILNRLNQRFNEDEDKLLRQERETQKEILKTLEGICL